MLWVKIIGSFEEKNFEEVKKLGEKLSVFLEEEGVELQIVTIGPGEDFKTLQEFKNNI